MGFGTGRIVFVHAVPNLLRSNLVFSMSDMVLNILTLASLSYLGLGVSPPMAEWGEMVAQGQKNLFNAWWMSTPARSRNRAHRRWILPDRRRLRGQAGRGPQMIQDFPAGVRCWR